MGDFGALWFTILQCKGGTKHHDFIEVGDQRFVFPLLELDRGTRQLLQEADSELVKLAASRIKRIDHKTVSIVGFEQTIAGTYSEARHRQQLAKGV